MRVLTEIKGAQSDFLHEAGQEFIRPFSIVLGHTYNTKDKISKEHTSAMKKIVTIFIAIILLPMTLLFGAIGFIMVSCSSSHKKAYKQIQEEQNQDKINNSVLQSLPKRNVNSAKLIKEKTLQVTSFIKEKGLQEKIALNARSHLSAFSRPCAYPEIIGCGTPFVNTMNELEVKNRQVLFKELSIQLQNSLNALQASDKNLILDKVLRNQINKYDEIVHQMENDLFNFLNQTDVTDNLKFDDQELCVDTLDENIKNSLRQRLTTPLSDKLNQFALSTQDALLTSAYCQLKQLKTGTGNTIYL